ncbi:NADH dehydrogenase [ubiquinone] 1 alpha subcomplex subunit 9, mitochondrial [Microplitis demolitor]|uniref:NADH dehydrogenase [ubiquinone] 1 alpha subcomplex subunit 9, mitochondrial n=1 Tax=Microplitis demolitor TaxID=69319 RepID=UPI00235B5D88|nr:NADH dehydrogenase [ubiquinone] 1 alpha subcomplex subunit 9, mitochondrial [Microplitis demolitor]
MAAINRVALKTIYLSPTAVCSAGPVRVQHQQSCKYSESSELRIIKKPTTVSLKRGTGGRSSFNGIVCTVFGSTGFLGRYVCNRLGKTGTQMILPYRGDSYDILPLKLTGDLGQVLFHPFQLRDEDSIRKCMKYSHVVVNLIGRDWETKNFTFDDVHVEGARRLARIARESGVERFIHVSSLNCCEKPTPILMEGGSNFLKSKWFGEQAVKEEFPTATIVRPGTVYGQEDRFLSALASTWRKHFRGVPVVGKGDSIIKQPLWAGDFGAGIAAIVKDPSTAGKTYQFAGPERFKLGDIVDWMQGYIRFDPIEYGHRRLDLNKSPLFKLKVFLAEFSVNHPLGYLHWEGLERESTTDVLEANLPTLADLGVQPIRLASRIHWEMKLYFVEEYYMQSVGEFSKPVAPKPVETVI